MINIKSNLKNIAGVFAISFFAACNSNESPDKVADTAATSDYSSAETMQSAPGTADTTTAITDVSASNSASTVKKKGKASAKMESSGKKGKVAMDKSGVYEYSDVMPMYPGGQSGLDSYVNDNIEYPQTALDYGKEGRVVVSFTVDENGKVMDAHTMGTKIGEGLDEEAERVVSNMPNWTPGTVKGKAVKTKMTLPITFLVEQ